MASPTKPGDMAELPAGKYEFKDNGIYIGEWYNDRAVGLGLITKDKSMGEFTGLWEAGCEKSGVFLWPNAPGAMYEGEWSHTKRHGFGVFTREDWMIMGRFKEDFIVTGVKSKDRSLGKYEGAFDNGLPTFGVETYADGGTYAGEYKNGIRNGLGIRTSIPYGDVSTYHPEPAPIIETPKSPPGGPLIRRDSLTSQRSGKLPSVIPVPTALQQTPPPPPPPTTLRPTIVRTNSAALPDNHSRAGTLMKMSTKFKCGFVLGGQKSEMFQARCKRRAERRRKAEMKKGKWKSLGSMGGGRGGSYHRGGGRMEGSFRSAHSAGTYGTLDSGITADWGQEDAIDPDCVESYIGEWLSDLRQGYGICERTDGVKYEGQWMNNLRNGYGITRFPDGTMEAGRYQNGELVILAGKKNPFLFFYSYHITKQVESAVRKARDIAEKARLRANEALKTVVEVRQDVEKAKRASHVAREYSMETRELVKELYPEFEQPGLKYLRDIARMMRVTKRGANAFEDLLNATLAVLEGPPSDAVSEAGQQDPNHPPTDGNLLTVDGPLGTRLGSRRGSFRGSFRSSRRHQRLQADGRLEPAKEGQIEKKQTQLTASAAPQTLSPQTPSQPITVQHHNIAPPQPIRAKVISQALQKVAPGQPIKAQIRRAGQPLPLMITDQAGAKGMQMPSHYDVIEGDPSAAALHDPEEIKYVMIPVPKIESSSAIPTIPLQNLLNPDLISDHFDHYATLPPISSRPKNSLKAKPQTNKHRQPLPQNLTNGISANTNKYQPPITLLPPTSPIRATRRRKRRRTMPAILICPQVKPFSLVPSQSKTTDDMYDDPDCPEHFETASVFIIENGIKIRARPLSYSFSMLDTSPSTSSLRRRSKSANTKPVTNFPRLGQRPPQDELSQLPTNYRFESLIELRKDLGEGSLPELSICKKLQDEVLISKDEVQKLGEMHRVAKEMEFQRRLQGEIVIQFSDFKDWCQHHKLLILVLLINLILCGCFYTLLTSVPTTPNTPNENKKLPRTPKTSL